MTRYTYVWYSGYTHKKGDERKVLNTNSQQPLTIEATIETDFLGIKHVSTNLGNSYLITPPTWSDFTWEKNTVYKWDTSKNVFIKLGDASLANSLLSVSTPGDVQPIPPDSSRPLPVT